MRKLMLPHLTVALLMSSVLSTRADEAPSATQGNTLLQRLLHEGVTLTDDVTVRLPEPEVPDGLEPEQRREIITRIAGRYGWRQFVRPSAVAPFVLRQAYIKDSQQRRVGHALDLWFVAHGTLADLQSQRTAEDLFGEGKSENGSPGNSMQELSADILSCFGLGTVDPERERFVLVESSIMNRVYVRGIGHAQRSRTPESLLIAWELDTRFNSDKELAARWQPIEATPLGERRRGNARLYQGVGGYAKITPLAEPEGAMLFEVHSVLHEPEDWFQGSNFLRAKAPLIVREQVDKLRRKLALAK